MANEYKIECLTNLKNTGGLSKCLVNAGKNRFFILVPDGTEFADSATVGTLSNWTTKIQAAKASRIFPLPPFFTYTPEKEDDVFFAGDANEQAFVRDGYRNGSMAMYVHATPCMIKALKSFNNQNWKAFAVTENGYIRGKSTDNTKFEGFKVFFHAGSLKEAGGDDPEQFPVEIYWKEPIEQYQALIKPSGFDPLTDLKGLINLDITDAGTEVPATTNPTIVLDIEQSCDATPSTDLVLADFKLTDPSGNDDTSNISGVTANGDGTYTVTFTALVTGDYIIDLLAPASMTTTGYESAGALTFTVAS